MRLLRLHRWTLLLGIVCLAGGLLAAPFAKEIEFQQPDGTAIKLWGQGDEFYAVFETLDGYTVVFDKARKAYDYATLSPDGAQLVSAGLEVGKGNPQALGVATHLRISDEARGKQVRSRFEKWNAGMKVTERWAARKAARRLLDEKTKDGPALAPPDFTTTGQKMGLCLLIDFDDDPASIPQAQIVNFCNGDNYAGFGNNGSVKKYFMDNSNNLLIYSNTVTAYIRIPNSVHSKSWYADTSEDAGLQANIMIRDALAIMQSLPNFESEIKPTFEGLTVDGQNQVVACSVFYAGGNGGVWAMGLWPHSWELVKFDPDAWGYVPDPQELWAGGKKLLNYQVTNIGSTLSIGTFCHENGHMLCGYPDIYDYDYDSTGGAGSFCLMDYGGPDNNPVQICAYLKYVSGWSTTVEVTYRDGVSAVSEALPGAEGFNRFYRYAKPGTATEYYLFENRQNTGRDASLPSSGIAIWHVDELGDRDNQSLKYNTTHANYECTLVQADNQWHFQKYMNSGDENDLYYQGNTAAAYTGKFHDGTQPSARWWDGSASRLEARDFSESGPVMTFSIAPSPPNMLYSGALPNGRVGTPYNLLLTAVGGVQPYLWSVLPGDDLPVGLTLDSDGLLSGMPEVEGDAAFSLIVAGENGAARTNAFTLLINPPFAAPFVETFENGGTIPDGWTQESDTGLPWVFRNGSPEGHPVAAHGGAYNAFLAVHSPTQRISRLISPRIDFGWFPRDARMTFWLNMEKWVNAQDVLRVYYKTYWEEEWTLLETYDLSVSQWTQQTLTLPDPSETYYVAFEGTAKYGYGICIDDVQIWDPTPPLGIADESPLPFATTDVPYSLALTAQGGDAPYTFEIVSGSLPSGFDMSADGVISGVSDEVQTAEFVVQVTDDWGETAFKVLELSVFLPRADLFAEDFENGGLIPDGWTQEYVTNTVAWLFQNGGRYQQRPSASVSGNCNAFLWSGAWANGGSFDQKTKLVSPAIDLGQAPAHIRLTFWHYMERWDNGQDELRVFCRTSLTAPWVLLATYTDSTAVWTQRSITLPNPSSTYYVAFEGNARFGYGVCIDDVRITDEADAPIITTSQALPNGVTGFPYSITLAATGGAEPYLWSVVSNSLPSGLTLSDDGIISGTPDTVTRAFFRVRVMNGDGSGKASTNLFSLRVTAPGPLPFRETFEHGGAMPYGWTQETLNGVVNWISRSGSPVAGGIPSAAYAGSYNACFFSGDPRSYKITRLITPALNLGVGTLNTRLTFRHCMAGYNGKQDWLSVLYKTSADAEWQVLASYSESVPAWTERTIDLPNPSATYYIAFEGWATYGYGVCIDDVMVTGDITPTYENWKSANFSSDEIADGLITGDQDDPDGDNVPNGLEYAMGLDPRVFDTVGLPAGGVEGGYLIYTYRENKEATDVTFEVEACTSLILQDWTTNGVYEILRDDSNTWWQVTSRHGVPITTAPQRFLRLKVYLP